MSVYLNRYAFKPLGITAKPDKNTGIIIVIPVFNEPDLVTALSSLNACESPATHTEVIIVINEPESSTTFVTQQNDNTFRQAKKWIEQNTRKDITYFLAYIKLPKKHAGVGLARKAGMDEAVRRFETIENENGIILCYDADCTCEPTYLNEVYLSFKNNNLFAASIYFEHKIDSLTQKEQLGILQYELHLRYYVNALRKAGYPYAFHTVGSSMAVRADIYKKAGGMNKRKAGEDFHFLHKIIPYDNFDEISTSTNFPSARISDRVPFGTGKAMSLWMNDNKRYLLSYNPEIFDNLDILLKHIPEHFKLSKIENKLSKLPIVVQRYLENEDYQSILEEINKQSTSMGTFLHRWFSWFNGLKALHFVHYLRDNAYSSIPVTEAARKLMNIETLDTKGVLNYYRNMDRKFKADQISLKHLYYGYL